MGIGIVENGTEGKGKWGIREELQDCLEFGQTC